MEALSFSSSVLGKRTGVSHTIVDKRRQGQYFGGVYSATFISTGGRRDDKPAHDGFATVNDGMATVCDGKATFLDAANRSCTNVIGILIAKWYAAGQINKTL